MKLKQFIGKDVRGYMNFDISFDESLNFLIGINGSGKTTVLKLISGLLCPSFIELAQIEFSSVMLICEQVASKGEIKITCEKSEKELFITFEGENPQETVSNSFPILDFRPFQSIRSIEPYEFEQLNHITYEFDKLEVVVRIKDLRTPLFLGLNRKAGNYDSALHSYERSPMYSRRRKVKDDTSDSVDSALWEIQEMIHTFVREKAQSQYKIAEDFRKKVFSESFKFEPFSKIPSIDYNKEMNQLEYRREQLNDAIEKLQVSDLLTQFSAFFDSVKSTLNEMDEIISSNDSEEMPIEFIVPLIQWMINSSQLGRIDSIIKYANLYSLNIQNLNEPLIRFENSANIFFSESKKKIEVDNKGEILVKMENRNKNNSIFELSSGEKQLIILLAHLAMHKSNKNTTIFIVDEPELSLHISWQELFVDALLKASPNTQYILATHAPAIISTIDRQKNCIDLSLGN